VEFTLNAGKIDAASFDNISVLNEPGAPAATGMVIPGIFLKFGKAVLGFQDPTNFILQVLKIVFNGCYVHGDFFVSTKLSEEANKRPLLTIPILSIKNIYAKHKEDLRYLIRCLNRCQNVIFA